MVNQSLHGSLAQEKITQKNFVSILNQFALLTKSVCFAYQNQFALLTNKNQDKYFLFYIKSIKKTSKIVMENKII